MELHGITSTHKHLRIMSTKTATDLNLKELAFEYLEYSQELLDCDPSVSEDALEHFISVQEWGEMLHGRARRLGFTWEQIEDEADSLEDN